MSHKCELCGKEEETLNFYAELRLAQVAFPYLRIGQIIDNALVWCDTNRRDGVWYVKDGVPDLFYTPDETLAKALKLYREAYEKGELPKNKTWE